MLVITIPYGGNHLMQNGYADQYFQRWSRLVRESEHGFLMYGSGRCELVIVEDLLMPLLFARFCHVVFLVLCNHEAMPKKKQYDRRVPYLQSEPRKQWLKCIIRLMRSFKRR